MSKTLVMIGTQKGAFHLWSDEKREKWEVEGPLLKGWKVQDIVLDQRTEPTMYASVGHYVYGPTVHISKDFGKNWEVVEKSPRYAKDSKKKLNGIWCIVPGRKSEPDTIFAGVDEAGLFVSKDKGYTWSEFKGLSNHKTSNEWYPGLGGLCCHSIALDPKNKKRMWVGISAVGTFYTEDGGETWETQNEGVTKVIECKEHKDIGFCVHHLLIAPKNPNRLFQQNHRGVYRSDNSGNSWTKIENGLPTSFGFPMAISPQNSNTLFVIPLESDEYRMTKDGKLSVYKTTNAGETWEEKSQGLPENSFVTVLRQSLNTDNHGTTGVYFGTANGQMFCSNDNGETWSQMPGIYPRILSVNTAIVE